MADRLAATITEHGADAVGVYLGNPNAHSVGFATHGVPFVKSLRTRNRFSASTVDQIPHQFVAWQLFGHQLLLPVPDLDRTSFFLVLGANPMASNGSLMTVPDFPQRVRDLKARGGRMVVLDPRRTETAKVATEHHFVRPGSDAAVLLAMLHVLFEEGLTTPPPYVDHVDRVAELVADFTPELAEAASGVPADTIRSLARDFAAADAAAAYGRMGLSTQGFGSVCQWAINLLNLLTGNFDREGGVLFPEPAVDTVGRRIVGPGHHDVWRSRVPADPGVRRRAAGGDDARGDRDARRRPDPGDGDDRRQPGAVHARRARSGRGPRRPRLHGRGRHLPQRDHPARRRDPAADLRARARPVRPDLPRLRGPQHRAVHPCRLRQARRRAHDWEIFGALAERVQARLGAGLKDRLATKARFAPSPATIITGLLKTGGRTTMRALRKHPEGVDLGPLRPTMPERLQTADKRIDLAPELVVADLDRVRTALDGTVAAGAGRAAADRPPAPAGLQLLAAQHPAAHPRQAAAPPAHAPDGPGRARPRGRRRRPGHLTGRHASTSRSAASTT